MTKVEVSGASAAPNAALVNGACEQSPPSVLRSTGGHTPGPWRVRTNNPNYFGIAADCSGMVAYTSITQASPHRAEGEANARLIAAAPELLEALKDARSVIATMTGCLSPLITEALVGTPLENIDAAIAKAEGRS